MGETSTVSWIDAETKQETEISEQANTHRLVALVQEYINDHPEALEWEPGDEEEEGVRK